MIKKINISESEREKILNLHKVLNEDTGLSINGYVFDLSNSEPIFDAKVTLMLSNVTKGMAKTDADGVFKFEGLVSGDYVVVAEAQMQGYIKNTINVSLSNQNVSDVKLLLGKTEQELPEVVVGAKRLTFLDFNFIDGGGKQIPNVTYSLYKDKKTEIGTYTAQNGKSSLRFDNHDILLNGDDAITYPENGIGGFFHSDMSGSCKEQKELIIVAKSEGYIDTKQVVNFCISNGSYDATIAKENGVVTATPSKSENGVPSRYQSSKSSNIFNVVLIKPMISAKLLTLDDEDVAVPNVKINIYKDKNRQEVLQTVVSNQKGEVSLNLTSGNFDFFTDENDQIKRVRLYFDFTKEGYNPLFNSVVLKYGKEETFEFNLRKVKVPKAKEISIRQCRIFTKKLP